MSSEAPALLVALRSFSSIVASVISVVSMAVPRVAAMVRVPEDSDVVMPVPPAKVAVPVEVMLEEPESPARVQYW